MPCKRRRGLERQAMDGLPHVAVGNALGNGLGLATATTSRKARLVTG